ncbi:LAFA_0D15456g1_1 [Lachancea sp. 'fantastica']|nr:LAFA_0D15456g1_1 [Lachancea sp. 'fantastica']
MEVFWQSLNYGWLVVATLAQILRLGLYSMVAVLLGPLAVLYVYDVALYTWRVVLNRGKRSPPVFGPDQRALETEETAIKTAEASTKPTLPSRSTGELDSSPYSSDTDWDSITATSPADEENSHPSMPSSMPSGSADTIPRISGIHGSFTRFSDLITVTISAGAGDSAATIQTCEKREAKLVSGRS